MGHVTAHFCVPWFNLFAYQFNLVLGRTTKLLVILYFIIWDVAFSSPTHSRPNYAPALPILPTKPCHIQLEKRLWAITRTTVDAPWPSFSNMPPSSGCTRYKNSPAQTSVSGTGNSLQKRYQHFLHLGIQTVFSTKLGTTTRLRFSNPFAVTNWTMSSPTTRMVSWMDW